MTNKKILCSWVHIETVDCEGECLAQSKPCEHFWGITPDGKNVICNKKEPKEEIER